jgi:hypothetical protein
VWVGIELMLSEAQPFDKNLKKSRKLQMEQFKVISISKVPNNASLSQFKTKIHSRSSRPNIHTNPGEKTQRILERFTRNSMGNNMNKFYQTERFVSTDPMAQWL